MGDLVIRFVQLYEHPQSMLSFAVLCPALLCTVFITVFHFLIRSGILLSFYLVCKIYLSSFKVEKDLPCLSFSIYLSLFLSNAPFSGIMTV